MEYKKVTDFKLFFLLKVKEKNIYFIFVVSLMNIDVLDDQPKCFI
jgi:hypothetical protein